MLSREELARVIQINKSEIDLLNIHEISYHIRHLDSNTRGLVSVSIEPSSNLTWEGDWRYTPDVIGSLRKLLENEEKVANIHRFYPNGAGELTNWQAMKQGIGSFVLERVIDDAKDIGVFFIYSFFPSPSFSSMLTKHHKFQYVREYICYRNFRKQ